jgi:hypothetical protein
VNFSSYGVDLKKPGYGRTTYVGADEALFQVEVEVKNIFLPWIENGQPNFKSLSVSSPFLYITAWTADFHLHRTDKSEWEIINPEYIDDRHLASVHIMEHIDPGEFSWKALLLGSDGGLWWAPMFLLINEVDDSFERVGICTFFVKNMVRMNVGNDKAYLGAVELLRERVKLG